MDEDSKHLTIFTCIICFAVGGFIAMRLAENVYLPQYRSRLEFYSLIAGGSLFIISGYALRNYLVDFKGTYSGVIFGMLMLGFMGIAIASITITNSVFDKGKLTELELEIVGKYVHGSFITRFYYLNSASMSVRVSKRLYNRIEKGDKLIVVKKPGLYRIEWIDSIEIIE